MYIYCCTAFRMLDMRETATQGLVGGIKKHTNRKTISIKGQTNRCRYKKQPNPSDEPTLRQKCRSTQNAQTFFQAHTRFSGTGIQRISEQLIVSDRCEESGWGGKRWMNYRNMSQIFSHRRYNCMTRKMLNLLPFFVVRLNYIQYKCRQLHLALT